MSSWLVRPRAPFLLLLVSVLFLVISLPVLSADAAASVAPKFRLGSLTVTPNEDWASHVYIFVGGDHNTGTSVTERLLSSQPYASQLKVETTVNVSHMEHCHKHRTPTSCAAPENEGIFVTDVFKNLYIQRGTDCHAKPASHWGLCARKQQLTEKDITSSIHLEAARNELYQDWNQFWNLSNVYLVEKDISNAVKSRFLQTLFSSQHVRSSSNGVGNTLNSTTMGSRAPNTGFVYVLRHPFASCKDFKCDTHTHLRAWLETYTTLTEDIEHLDVYIMFHLEGLITDTTSVINAIRQHVGYPSMTYLNGKGESCVISDDDQEAVCSKSERRRLGYHKNANSGDSSIFLCLVC
jgi:hypothetical protein